MNPDVLITRHFYPTNQGNEPSDLLATNRSLQWEDLLGFPHVVVLGEPGVGKTFEMERIAETGELPGKSFFFCTASEVLDGRPVRVSDLARFEKAQERGDKLLFLIDSLDEGNLLPQGAKVETLFGKLYRSAELQGVDRGRIHWILSARPAYWALLPDRHRIEDYCFANARPEADKRAEGSAEDEEQPEDRQAFVQVVSLNELNEVQVQQFCESQFGEEGLSFFEAIKEQGIQVGIPRQIKNWYSFWKHHGSFGTRESRMQDYCKKLLDEPNEKLRREGISDAWGLTSRDRKSVV